MGSAPPVAVCMEALTTTLASAGAPGMSAAGAIEEAGVSTVVGEMPTGANMLEGAGV